MGELPTDTFLSTGIFSESTDRSHMTSLEIFPGSQLYIDDYICLIQVMFCLFPLLHAFLFYNVIFQEFPFLLALPIISKVTKFSQC